MTIGAIGKFQVLGTLGSGAHSSILHIRRSADSKQYALKVVPIEDKDDLKYLEQAQHEFRIAQMVSHPSLVKVHALETPRDWLFRVRKVHLLIEYINGKTLDTMKGLSVPRLVQIFERIASALAHLHRRNIWHADLKPSNIMLSRAGEVKIIDYGLARVKGESRDRVQGTPEYMAPEQARGGTVNEGTDIYNFGATMYRLVTWRLPPNVLTATDDMPMDTKMFQSLLKPVRECNSEAPRELCNLIQQCLSFKPDKRPEHVSEILTVLEQLVEDLVQTPEDRLNAMEW
ncbi:MAG: serine/threonine protein kinase [Gemmataceae bacterium]|nr:serine/threonine protein kinase [Gemmataceae bacterium]